MDPSNLGRARTKIEESTELQVDKPSEATSTQMTTQDCLAWRIKNDRKTESKYQLTFKGGLNSTKKPLRFYVPFRCKGPSVTQGLCKDCHFKKLGERDNRIPCGNYPSRYWGMVTEPIQDLGEQRSLLAFSPWFLASVKLYGISDEHLQRAREAWAVAVAGLNEVPPLPDMGDGVVMKPTTVPVPAPVPVPAAVPVPVPVPVPAPVPVPVSAPVPVPKKSPVKLKVVAALAGRVEEVKEEPPPKVKRSKKVVSAIPLSSMVAVVSEETPIEVERVETIEVRSTNIKGMTYYVDSRKNKVYDPKTGSYVGRYDSARDLLITSLEDSDQEQN